MNVLRLPEQMRHDIFQHAKDEYPRECCGLIAGKEGKLVHLFRLTNVEAGNRLYRIDDDELYSVTRSLDQRDEDIAVIYHSHPVTPAYPSKTDVELAFWSEAVYIICSLEDFENPYLRAFRIVDESIDEVEIDII
jgi:proteasome lid subunit RPN8/RPN11